MTDLAGGNPRYVDDGPLAAAVADRLGFLSEQTARILRMAALLGMEFSTTELVTATGLPAATVVDGIEEARAAGVLTRSPLRFAFRHALVRQALYDRTPASLRYALHRHAAEALASAAAPVERVAEQLLAASGVVDDWVVTWLASEAAGLTRRTPPTAAKLLQRSLDHLPADDFRREPTEIGLATALRLLARFDDLEQLARRALAQPRDAGHRAQMIWQQAFALMHTRPEEGLIITSSPMLDQDLGDHWVARLGALRALILGVAGRFREVGAVAGQALAAAGPTGDRVTAGYALHAMAVAASRTGAGHAMELTRQALVAAGDDPETAELRLVLLSNQTSAFDRLGMRAEADAAVRDALALAGQVSTSPLIQVQVHVAVHWFEVGRWDEALVALESVDEVPQTGYLPVRLHGLRALIAGHRDDRATVRRHLNELDDRSFPAEMIREHGRHLVLARALSAERDGRPAQALRILARQFASKRRVGPPTGHYGLADIVRLALGLGNQAYAHAVVDACAVDAEQHLKYAATVARCRGLLNSDPDLLLGAAEYFRTAGEPFELAVTLEDAAAVYGQQGRTAAGRAAFAESVAAYVQLGAMWDIRRAEFRVRPYGIGRGQRGPRRRPATGWHALTPTELKVAHLVTQGRSNPDIASELFLSRRTVQTHVSHILAKLDVRSRGEVARHAAGHEQDGPVG